jgi:hypothetical protein
VCVCEVSIEPLRCWFLLTLIVFTTVEYHSSDSDSDSALRHSLYVLLA